MYLTKNDLLQSSIFESYADAKRYVEAAYGRFCRTIWLAAQEQPTRIFEFGANPYFLTRMLAHAFPNAVIRTANWFGFDLGQDNIVVQRTQRFTFTSLHFNIEHTEHPAWDQTGNNYDLVLFCEILEHMLVDPTPVIQKINGMMRPGGRLILTTPNVFWTHYLLEWEKKKNIYPWYSEHGAYGRHNRLWATYEIEDKAEEWGFQLETIFTESVVDASVVKTKPSSTDKNAEGIFAVLRKPK